jgi:transcriptional regulator with XRE-family HTH domain
MPRQAQAQATPRPKTATHSQTRHEKRRRPAVTQPRTRKVPLGEFIRRQRQLHELTLRQLAEMSGISNPYLSQIERGLRAPSEKVVEALADNLQLSAEALYEHAGRARDGGAAPDASPVIEAIKADPRLTAKQRQALLTVYDAFAGGRRGG